MSRLERTAAAVQPMKKRRIAIRRFFFDELSVRASRRCAKRRAAPARPGRIAQLHTDDRSSQLAESNEFFDPHSGHLNSV